MWLDESNNVMHVLYKNILNGIVMYDSTFHRLIYSILGSIKSMSYSKMIWIWKYTFQFGALIRRTRTRISVYVSNVAHCWCFISKLIMFSYIKQSKQIFRCIYGTFSTCSPSFRFTFIYKLSFCASTSAREPKPYNYTTQVT